MSHVNSLSDEDFITTFGNLVENCPLVAASVVSCRPFNSLMHLHAEICSFIDELPLKGREGILRGFSMLGLPSLQQTEESRRESKVAGVPELVKSHGTEFNNLNKSYSLKFGFPFVICTWLNKEEDILHGLRSRLHNSPEEELHTGIEEVKKIALLRLKNLVSDDMDSKM
ncbi:2-oxo-4-hydroxy-4-carboxy-5-ureidoimidazoline decarboxylase [Portunus trituberculatus]|uniref:2-oxo-4-hydroxy-4-carboxy-5-ureidoimidazoline decarboxylase n=1 Tax=Portunus trituberculatus TaxID=210409 RepID=A0A5B7HR71_PORTR|nr:2-oxo-4-hydroxy-4-carboxy-5-ureidoimidazoline decarboxylase [Portunus trituberculatus]